LRLIFRGMPVEMAKAAAAPSADDEARSQGSEASSEVRKIKE